MASQTSAAILELANQAKNFAPAAAERRPTFLSLAPATSASYPQQPAAKLTPTTLAQVPETPELKQRRTSSMSSDGNKSTGFRFLKLGPVHWGEHQDENKADWHAVE
jgi:hypothetical protein